MTAAYWITGDTRTVLRQMAAAGIVVDLAVTSPPFLGLRSYLPDGDPAKALEMGSEATPGEFIDGLLDVTVGCDAVLAPHGSIAVELGDTRAGSGGSGGDYNEGGMREGQARWMGTARSARESAARMPWKGERDGWPADKSLALIPELYRLALAYGFNPLTGRTTTPWRVRNVVRWVRPNPPVGRDGDKFRPATSEVVIACRTDEAGRRRYWDGDAVRVPAKYGVVDQQRPGDTRKYGAPGQPDRQTRARTEDGRLNSNPAGAPLLDWWKITAAGFPGSHYATFPAALVEPLVKTMCPQRVCTVCGEPSRRITETINAVGKAVARRAHRNAATGHDRSDVADINTAPDTADRLTVGWSDCGHGDAWRPGIVLDPFAGSGTTGMVSTGHGAIFIGIDLDPRNRDLARDRVGPLFFHEVTVAELAEVLGAGRTSGRGAA